MTDGPTSDADDLRQLRARVTALEAAASERPPRHRARSFLAAVLIVIGCVLAPLAMVSAWTADVIGDTDRYVETVAPLASEPAVQAAAATRAADAVTDHLDLTRLLEGVAPKDRPRLEKALGKLGGALEGAVGSFVQKKSQEVVASGTFQKFWTDANRRIHQTVDKALTGKGGGAVELNQNSVSIDLAPVIEQVKKRLVDAGLTPAQKIPVIHTDLTVLKSDDIGRLKTYFRVLQLAGNWLPVIAVILAAAGVLLSARRRRALVATALGFAVAALVLGIALTVFRVGYLDHLPANVSQAAAEAVYDTLIRFLRTSVRVVITLGVVIALAAWLTGPGHHATDVRRLWHAGIAAVRTTADRLGLRTGPVGPFVHRYRRWITWILVAGAVVAFLLWTHPTGWVVVGLVLALLFALSIVDFLAEEEKPAMQPAQRLQSP
ncbi:hypothetical protein [Streptomyces sp. V3I7]|uniref:hypothetical protein n=1 Tax=Streptomyces sp. V3I7 TaxID=3042278 RepID=UPI002789C262|nr:hypothetical protein [Streptomyces sp. V3I7]MDQ0992101.1 hypothetical protein [Streptomyces sp. V3I7]